MGSLVNFSEEGPYIAPIRAEQEQSGPGTSWRSRPRGSSGPLLARQPYDVNSKKNNTPRQVPNGRQACSRFPPNPCNKQLLLKQASTGLIMDWPVVPFFPLGEHRAHLMQHMCPGAPGRLLYICMYIHTSWWKIHEGGE